MSRGGPRRVGLCVDDFGMHGGVNDAVLRLASIDRLSAVGCLVDGPAFLQGARALVDAAAQAARDESRIDLGLHLDLTEGYTRTARPLRKLITAAYLRRLSPSELESEIGRQLETFERAIGHPPDFIDGHQHVHQLPQVREALIAVLRERPHPGRPWLRSTRRPRGRVPSRFKAGVIETLGAHALARLAADGGFAQNEHLLGVYGFDEAEGGYEALTERWLDASVDGDLLMCHPSAHTTAPDALLPARLREFRWLTSAGFGRSLEQRDIVIALPWFERAPVTDLV